MASESNGDYIARMLVELAACVRADTVSPVEEDSRTLTYLDGLPSAKIRTFAEFLRQMASYVDGIQQLRGMAARQTPL